MRAVQLVGCLDKGGWLIRENLEKKLKKVLTNSKEYVILNTEMRQGNREERKSQVDHVRPSRQRHLTAWSLCYAVYKCGPNPAGVKIKGLGRVKPEKYF